MRSPLLANLILLIDKQANACSAKQTRLCLLPVRTSSSLLNVTLSRHRRHYQISFLFISHLGTLSPRSRSGFCVAKGGLFLTQPRKPKVPKDQFLLERANMFIVYLYTRKPLA